MKKVKIHLAQDRIFTGEITDENSETLEVLIKGVNSPFRHEWEVYDLIRFNKQLILERYED